MLKAQELRSEITRLLGEIRQQHKNAQKGFAEPTHETCGMAGLIQHIDTMHELRRQLHELVGDAAIAMIAKELEAEKLQMVSDQPQVSATSSLAPSDLLDMHYSPELLLDTQFDTSITEDAEFPAACEWGFRAFLNEVESGDSGPFTESEVKARVRREMLEVLTSMDQVSLGWYVGFVLGWLSALAFVQRDEALAGLSELLALLGQLE